MYINFQQIWVRGSVKTMLTNIFANNRINLQLPIAILKKKRLIQTYLIVKRTCISIFSKLGLVDQSKPCTPIYLQKSRKLHKFTTTNSTF